ncbi:unnamed protein product, partial [Phaeothamnion confervicola]
MCGTALSASSKRALLAGVWCLRRVIQSSECKKEQKALDRFAIRSSPRSTSISAAAWRASRLYCQQVTSPLSLLLASLLPCLALPLYQVLPDAAEGHERQRDVLPRGAAARRERRGG